MSRHIGLAFGIACLLAGNASTAQTVGPIWHCQSVDSQVCGGASCGFEPSVRLEIDAQRRRMKVWHPVPILLEGPYRGHLETGERAVVELNGILMPISPPEPEWHVVTVEVNRETRQFTLYAYGSLSTGSCRFDRPR